MSCILGLGYKNKHLYYKATCEQFKVQFSNLLALTISFVTVPKFSYTVGVNRLPQCFDAVGWVVGRASGL